MLTFCPKCSNHYDDSSQSDVCDRETSHPSVRPSSLVIHVRDTRMSRGLSPIPERAYRSIPAG
jgi:hypothetical protein